LDRIDLHIEVEPVPFEDLAKKPLGEAFQPIRERVTAARKIQAERFQAFNSIHYNAQMMPKQLRTCCELNAPAKALIKTAMEKLGLSARAYDRILKVARTIADLATSDHILTEHIAEAIQYRSLDREGWMG